MIDITGRSIGSGAFVGELSAVQYIDVLLHLLRRLTIIFPPLTLPITLTGLSYTC